MPFEDPAKTALVARCRTAIEAAGHVLDDDPQPLPMPAEMKLQGSVQGDLQSRDSSNVRHVFVVRLGTQDSLPLWAVRWAAACHRMTDVRFYLAVEDFNEGYENECKKAGAGLLVITDADQLEIVHRFEDNLPDDLDDEMQDRVKALRKQMLTKQDLNLGLVKEKFNEVGTLTANFVGATADSYTKDVEAEHDAWTEWGDEINQSLDAALKSGDVGSLDEIERRIQNGPDIDRGDEDVE
jgi:hypothetical protein